MFCVFKFLSVQLLIKNFWQQKCSDLQYTANSIHYQRNVFRDVPDLLWDKACRAVNSIRVLEVNL